MLFRIKHFENYDGDSFSLTLDLGFDLVFHQKCRIEGVDTPELRGGTDEQKKAGYLARDRAREWCADRFASPGIWFRSETYRGKFGRPLGDISDAGIGSLREYLINNNYGVPYHGEAKSKVAAMHAKNLAILKERGEI